MYAVTFGSRSSFVMRVIRKPEKSISATEMITAATDWDVSINCWKEIMPNAELDNLQRKLDHIIECSLALFCTADLICNKRVADRHNGQRTHAIFGSQGVKFTCFHIYGQNAVIVHQLQLCIIAVIIKFITGVYAAGMSRDTPYSGELSSLCGQTKIRSRCEMKSNRSGRGSYWSRSRPLSR